MPDSEPRNYYEVIHNLNTLRWEFRAYGSNHSLFSGDTASEVVTAADDAGLSDSIRFVAGEPVTNASNAVEVAREVDFRSLGPPSNLGEVAAQASASVADDLVAEMPDELLPGESAMIADMKAMAAVGDAPEIQLPTLDEAREAKIAEAHMEWARAIQAQAKVVGEIGNNFADEEKILQYRIATEAVQAADKKLAELNAPGWEEGPEGPPGLWEDPPEATATATAGPSTGGGDSGAEAELHEVDGPNGSEWVSDAAEAQLGPDNPIALDMPEARAAETPSMWSGQIITDSAELSRQYENHMSGASIPVSELQHGNNATAIASRVFPDAHQAATENRPQIAKSAAKGKTKTAAKVLKRGGRR